eukprot:scaffold1747_cov251-Pinguiococcus_pyrenoidosus.AAC.20
MHFNGEQADDPTRFWYFPVIFPEASEMSKEADETTDETDRHEDPMERRPVRLESAKEERLRCGGKIPRPSEWQPVSRRRVRGKGWHIDAGPGFPNEGIRRLLGHPFQGVVLLLLLSDHSQEGCGNTCMVRGSHRWVRQKLEESEPEGMTHQELNQWAVDLMLQRIKEHRAWIVSDAQPDDVCQEGDADVRPLMGRVGDLCIMHPWLIHSGTTNLSDRVRFMGNGMVRIREDVFAQSGCTMLQEDWESCEIGKDA